MATTYTPLATTTLGSNTTTVTFSSISSAYTDLILVASTKNTTTSVNSLQMAFNSDSGSNYSFSIIYGDGSAVASARYTTQSVGVAGWDSTTNFTPTIINIQNYSNATTYKTAISRSADAGGRNSAFVNLWRSTAAISTVSLTSQSASFVTGSTFTLYGIKAA
jgi:hypothetical protein